MPDFNGSAVGESFKGFTERTFTSSQRICKRRGTR